MKIKLHFFNYDVKHNDHSVNKVRGPGRCSPVSLWQFVSGSDGQRLKNAPTVQLNHGNLMKSSGSEKESLFGVFIYQILL